MLTRNMFEWNPPTTEEYFDEYIRVPHKIPWNTFSTQEDKNCININYGNPYSDWIDTLTLQNEINVTLKEWIVLTGKTNAILNRV